MSQTYVQQGTAGYGTTYALTASCDATASGAETATHQVTTKRGQLALCGHHTALYGPAFLAAGYTVTALGETPEPAQSAPEPSRLIPSRLDDSDAPAGVAPASPVAVLSERDHCKNCPDGISELSPGFWIHDSSGSAACYPVQGNRSMAEPA